MFKLHRIWPIAFSPLLAACVTSSQRDCQAGETLQVYEQLYFGARSGDSLGSHQEWQSFLKSVITPRFPKGLTVIRGVGQWQDKNGTIVREPSYILSLVYPPQAQRDTAVVEIIALYKKRFEQEAVLRVKSTACVSLQ